MACMHMCILMCMACALHVRTQVARLHEEAYKDPVEKVIKAYDACEEAQQEEARAPGSPLPSPLHV